MTPAAPRRVAALVAVVVLAVTAVLTVLTWQVNARAERDLLHRQVAQAGTVLTTQVAVLTTQLADAGQVATATNASPGAFQRFAAARIAGSGGLSLSLWRIGDGGQPERLAVEGPDPTGPDGDGFAAFLSGVPADGTLAVTGILPGDPPHLGYALRPAGDTTGLVVYAEATLPPNRRVRVPAGQGVAGPGLGVCPGRRTTTHQLPLSPPPGPLPRPTPPTPRP